MEPSCHPVTSRVLSDGGVHCAQFPQWQSLPWVWHLQHLFHWQWQLHPQSARPQRLPEPILCRGHRQLLEDGWQLLLVVHLKQSEENLSLDTLTVNTNVILFSQWILWKNNLGKQVPGSMSTNAFAFSGIGFGFFFVCHMVAIKIIQDWEWHGTKTQELKSD